jgi:hypothetical protein
VDKYRIVIGNQTVVFEKEKDPSKLRAPSAGKLVNTLVEDGGHVDKGQPYAEIEVIFHILFLVQRLSVAHVSSSSAYYSPLLDIGLSNVSPSRSIFGYSHPAVLRKSRTPPGLWASTCLVLSIIFSPVCLGQKNRIPYFPVYHGCRKT